MNAAELQAGLCNFYGTEQWYRHGLNRNMLYTDGVKFFAENAGGGAYWFLDIVATELMQIHKKEEFINIVMTVHEDSLNIHGGARIVADDGNGRELWHRDIEYTDCPVGVWQFFLENQVVCLPSER